MNKGKHAHILVAPVFLGTNLCLFLLLENFPYCFIKTLYIEDSPAPYVVNSPPDDLSPVSCLRCL